MQERRVREKSNAQDFYTGSLKPELHPVCQGNLSLTLYYFKRFTKFTPLHFQNMQKHTQKTLESHKNQTSTTIQLLQTWKTTKHNHKAWERSNLSCSTTLPTTTTFFKLQTSSKILKEFIQDQSSPATICMITKETIISKIHAKKWSCYHSFEKYNSYCQTITKFNRLISLNLGEISW